MRSRPVAPTARAAVFAAACLGLAAVAHAAVSHAGIPVRMLGGGWLAVFLFGRIAAARERGLAPIAALVGGSQVVLHLLFTASQSGAGHDSAMAGTAGMAGMPDMAGMPSMTDEPAPVMNHLTVGMLCAHGIAALVTAWWLRRGEAAVYDCAQRPLAPLDAWLHRLRQLLLRAPEPCSAPATRKFDRRSARPTTISLIRFAVVRRGPPATTV